MLKKWLLGIILVFVLVLFFSNLTHELKAGIILSIVLLGMTYLYLPEEDIGKYTKDLEEVNQERIMKLLSLPYPEREEYLLELVKEDLLQKRKKRIIALLEVFLAIEKGNELATNLVWSLQLDQA